MTADYSRTMVHAAWLFQIQAFCMDFSECKFQQQSAPLRLSKLYPSEHLIMATSRSSTTFTFLHYLGIYPLVFLFCFGLYQWQQVKFNTFPRLHYCELIFIHFAHIQKLFDSKKLNQCSHSILWLSTSLGSDWKLNEYFIMISLTIKWIQKLHILYVYPEKTDTSYYTHKE